jgi:DNA repair protein RAD7
MAPPAAKKRKLTKAAEAKLKAKEKANAKGKKEDDDENSEDDAYNALSKSMWTNSSPSKPPVGNFENCAQCEKQFTVV